MKKSKAELRAAARYRAKTKTKNVLELADLVSLAAGAATNLVLTSKAPIEVEVATKVADVLNALGDALHSDDAPALDELHAVTLKQLAAKRDLWADHTSARYRLKKGGKANLRDDALEIARKAALWKWHSSVQRGVNWKRLAEIVGVVLARREVTAETLAAAFPNGWEDDDEDNAERLLVVALGSEKEARNAMFAAKDIAERRRGDKRSAD